MCRGPISGNSVACSRACERASVADTGTRGSRMGGITLAKKAGYTQAVIYIMDLGF